LAKVAPSDGAVETQAITRDETVVSPNRGFAATMPLYSDSEGLENKSTERLLPKRMELPFGCEQKLDVRVESKKGMNSTRAKCDLLTPRARLLSLAMGVSHETPTLRATTTEFDAAR
jgi:hypothetical protein